MYVVFLYYCFQFQSFQTRHIHRYDIHTMQKAKSVAKAIASVHSTNTERR